MSQHPIFSQDPIEAGFGGHVQPLIGEFPDDLLWGQIPKRFAVGNAENPLPLLFAESMR